MHTTYTTSRLSLSRLSHTDSSFIQELVNMPEWIQFIGNRNVNSIEDAQAYVQKIIDSPNVVYWVVRTISEQTPVGVVTFIKRHYLDHHDIGFAFLATHSGKGYAHEAATAVLNDAISDPAHERILATTLPENIRSIQLLKKLGFELSHEISSEGETLHVYAHGL